MEIADGPDSYFEIDCVEVEEELDDGGKGKGVALWITLHDAVRGMIGTGVTMPWSGWEENFERDEEFCCALLCDRDETDCEDDAADNGWEVLEKGG